VDPALIASLIGLAATLAPPFARLIAAGLEALIVNVQAMNTPATTAGVIAEIIRGIDADHPDWPGDQKRDWVSSAVAQYIANHGGTPDAPTINALVELGVQERLRVPA